ncbi:hypothetical protein Tco_0397034 [Tanacetum coccineum]
MEKTPTKEDTRSRRSTKEEWVENYLISYVVCVPSNFPKELVGFTPHRRMGFRIELVQGTTPICEGSCRLTSLERQEVWNDCRSFVKDPILLKRPEDSKERVRVAREDESWSHTKEEKDVRSFPQNKASGAMRSAILD